MSFTHTYSLNIYRIQDHWNAISTGDFICYDHDIENLIYIYKCPNKECPSKSVLYAVYMKQPYPNWKRKIHCCECGVKLITEDYNDQNN